MTSQVSVLTARSVYIGEHVAGNLICAFPLLPPGKCKDTGHRWSNTHLDTSISWVQWSLFDVQLRVSCPIFQMPHSIYTVISYFHFQVYLISTCRLHMILSCTGIVFQLFVVSCRSTNICYDFLKFNMCIFRCVWFARVLFMYGIRMYGNYLSVVCFVSFYISLQVFHIPLYRCS